MTTYKRVDGDYVIKTLGATDIVNIESTTTVITGDLSVSGNASLLGNISGDKLFNGTSNVEIASAGSNVTIGVGGTSVATYATTGHYISGLESVTGNVIGGNLTTAGNVTSGNLNTVGNIIITRDSSIGQPTIQFYDTDTTLSDGTVLGALEWYITDTTFPNRVTTRLRSVASGTSGNAQFEIQMSPNGTGAQTYFLIDNQGNVGVSNAAPLHTFAVTGTSYVSGNVTGGNIITGGAVSAAGNVSATGNVLGGNILTGGISSTTGNITGGNIISLGAISAGAGGVSATGNVTGGNVNSTGILSITGNITGGNVITGTTLSAQANVLAGNVSAVGNITGSNISISSNMSGTGIGVENIVLQSTDTVVSSASMANIGSLTFNALENQIYKFEAFMPIVPDGSSTTGFSMNFASGTCQYVVEAQTTATSTFNISSSNVSDDSGATQGMTGTTLRTVRITGTFTHTGNVTVSVGGQTSVANLTVKAGSYLTYTRIG